MTNPRLVPTRITDKNGRGTTVYRRPVAAAAAPAVPPPPTPPARPELRREYHFRLPSWGAECISADAPDPELVIQNGMAHLTDTEAFAYLRLGVGIDCGAAMNTAHPDPVHWEQSEAARRVAERRGRGRTDAPLGAAVNLMGDLGYSPAEVQRMLDKGLDDGCLHGVLAPDDVAYLFERVRCRAPEHENPVPYARMRQCFLDGTMPISLVRSGVWDRDLLLALAAFAVESRSVIPGGGKISEFHAAVEEDPGLWVNLAEVIDKGFARSTTPEQAWKALRAYGKEDCRRFGVQRLLAGTDEGMSFGDVLREARAHGMSDTAIEEAVRAHDGRVGPMLAVARGGAAPAVADGWL